jgi:hypothetical protein
MNKLLILISLLFITVTVMAIDTTFYENGQIKSIYKKSKFKKEFYVNGKLMEQLNYETFIKKGKKYEYDSLGNLTSKGKFFLGFNKHGTWKFYEEGKNVDKVKFKFGEIKSELVNEKGKKLKCYFTYGFGAYTGECKEVENKFRITNIAIAGCIVSNKIIFRSAIHNFFVSTTMVLKHGLNWEDKVDEYCEFERAKF